MVPGLEILCFLPFRGKQKATQNLKQLSKIETEEIDQYTDTIIKWVLTS